MNNEFPSQFDSDDFYELDPDFTWIVKGVMAASCMPNNSLLANYKEQGIKVIINCSDWEYNFEDKKFENYFSYYFIPILDFGVPGDAEIRKLFEICEQHQAKKEPIVVHCMAGCGRTGQLLCAWGAKNNIIPKEMDPVKWIRSLRKCCLENPSQERFAREIQTRIQQKEFE
jgi:Polymorphic toxin system, DSP-PTPase phosphatase